MQVHRYLEQHASIWILFHFIIICYLHRYHYLSSRNDSDEATSPSIGATTSWPRAALTLSSSSNHHPPLPPSFFLTVRCFVSLYVTLYSNSPVVMPDDVAIVRIPLRIYQLISVYKHVVTNLKEIHIRLYRVLLSTLTRLIHGLGFN